MNPPKLYYNRFTRRYFLSSREYDEVVYERAYKDVERIIHLLNSTCTLKDYKVVYRRINLCGTIFISPVIYYNI
jgi:hypothetical protein